MFMAMTAMAFGMASCSKDSNENHTADDSRATAVAEQFVDHTVAPTYGALAAKTELFANHLLSLKTNATDAGVREACQTFLAAREEWEKSEAFLFGAAGDYGIDPHIDSWPLDKSLLENELANNDKVQALDGDDGDEVAYSTLSNANLGFHAVEYILFKDGQPKAASQISHEELVYVAAVAGDLRNNCYRLEVAWVGEAAPANHIEKLDNLEWSYTLTGSGFSYGKNMKLAGQAGSTYASRKAALLAIVQGCIDIADEVGTSKIGAAYSGEDPTYIESPYSYMSIDDFHNNIVSIQNTYMGGVESQRDESKSLHSYVKDINASLDNRVTEAINNALAKIDAMPKPFVNNISAAANGQALEACTALSDVLDEVVEAIRNN